MPMHNYQKILYTICLTNEPNYTLESEFDLSVRKKSDFLEIEIAINTPMSVRPTAVIFQGVHTEE